MDKNKFGMYIKEKRNEKGLTQKELADILIIDVTAVSKWERGVTFPDITMIGSICKALSISEHELIESTNDTETRRMVSEGRRYEKLKKTVFCIFLVAYLAAVLICGAVNIAVGGRAWSLIVLFSCLCGFCFFPSFVKFIKTAKTEFYLLTTYVSSCLLFLTVCIYTDGSWGFVAAVGMLLGYFLVFWPIVFTRQKRYLPEESYKNLKRIFLLTYSAVLYLLTHILLYTVSKMSGFDLYVPTRIVKYSFSIMFAFGFVELFNIKRTVKLSIDSFLTAAYLCGLNGVLNKLLAPEKTEVYKVDFGNWAAASDGNVTLIVTAAFIAVGFILAVVALINKIKE